jgi:hypothetical protein
MNRPAQLQGHFISRLNTTPQILPLPHRPIQQHEQVNIAVGGGIPPCFRTKQPDSSQPLAESGAKRFSEFEFRCAIHSGTVYAENRKGKPGGQPQCGAGTLACLRRAV